MRGFQDILNRYKAKHQLNLGFEIFDVRKKCQVPEYDDFDIYISSGGPGRSLGNRRGYGVGERKYFNLIDKLEDHNLSNTAQKKHVFFCLPLFSIDVP